jgi:hypothetical protein
MTLKKCPSCAEMVQGDARKCRYCGGKIGPGKTGNIIGITVTILTIFAIATCGKEPHQNTADAKPTLDAETRAMCTKSLNAAVKAKSITFLSGNNRMNVPDIGWQISDATAKRQYLALLACHAYGRKASELNDDQYVVAYGAQSGKRLAMLTSVGVDFE